MAKVIAIHAFEFLKFGFFHESQVHSCLGVCVNQNSYNFV